MAQYFKLGTKASVFFDPATKLKVVNSQVVKVDNRVKSEKIIKALRNGHLEKATKEEYEAFISGDDSPDIDVNPVDNKNNQSAMKAKFMKMKKGAVVDWVNEYGLDDIDLEKLQAVESESQEVYVDKLLEILEEYETES